MSATSVVLFFSQFFIPTQFPDTELWKGVTRGINAGTGLATSRTNATAGPLYSQPERQYCTAKSQSLFGGPQSGRAAR